MCPESLAGCRGASPQGTSSPPSQRGNAHTRPHPEEPYHDEYIRLPAGKDAELVFLRGVIEEGESRGWKLISAIKQPGADVLLVTWDTPGSFSG